MKKSMTNKARRLLSVMLSVAVLLSCVIWTGVSAATGTIDFDFESNPEDYYKTSTSATNNTIRENYRASLELTGVPSKTGTGAMKMAFLGDVSASNGPAFRITDEDDATSGFAPAKSGYYKVTFSYYVASITCDVNLRVLFGRRNWSVNLEVIAGGGESAVNMATVKTEDETGKWVTVTKVVYCAYNRAHIAMCAPDGGKAGTTVYIDDLKMEPFSGSVYTLTLNPNYDGATAATEYAEAGEYAPCTPIRKQYVFDGWYTDAACTEGNEYAGSVTADTALYAKWRGPYGTVSHDGVLDFEGKEFALGDELNLITAGSIKVSSDYNRTDDGLYSAQVTSTTNVGDTCPQFNLTDAHRQPLQVKADCDYKVSFWAYVPEGATHSNIRYWLAVTDSTQKNADVVLESEDITCTPGEWKHIVDKVEDAPRDGYLRLGIYSTKADEMIFYVDDIHAIALSGEETVQTFEELVTDDLENIRRGKAAVSTDKNHTQDGSRSLRLTVINYSGFDRNQMILTDPSTLEPYDFEKGVYYTLSMWLYSDAEVFAPNIWLWGTDDASIAFNKSADKNDKNGTFEYDGAAPADTDSGYLEPSEWTHLSVIFKPTNGRHMLMGITSSTDAKGQIYYIDDMSIYKTPTVQVTYHANGGKFSSGAETITAESVVGLLHKTPETPILDDENEFAGWYLDSECTKKYDETEIVDTTVNTLYAGWRPWSGVCYHAKTCVVYCEDCGVVRPMGAHDFSNGYKIDASGHWRVCKVCGAYEDSAAHVYSADCDGTCEVCGYDRGSSHKMMLAHSASGHRMLCSLCGEGDDFIPHAYTDDTDAICDECGYERFSTGDLNGDGVVDEQDAVYLAYHLFFPEFRPVYQDWDFNKDGVVNNEDALYLMHHAEDPQQYPLGAQQTPNANRDDYTYTLG